MHDEHGNVALNMALTTWTLPSSSSINAERLVSSESKYFRRLETMLTLEVTVFLWFGV